MPRRSFLRAAGLSSLAAFFRPTPGWSRSFQGALERSAGIPAETLAEDEDFWQAVRQAFTVSPTLINLNNGGVSPAPRTVQEAMKRYYDFSNEAPSYFMWRILDAGREPLRAKLAGVGGCSPEEIAIDRNASEGLETVIFGLTLKRGDEVVAARQDYPNMVHAWKQRELRDGVQVVWVDLQLPSEDEEYLVRQYVQAFTPRTRVVHLTHIINWNGQVLPVRRIAGEARRRGIDVLVDGAHSFAHLNFSIPDLGADYYATSLHKWLYAPIGSGLLYVRREKIRDLYPLFAAPDPGQENIRKFEHLGTRPFYIEQAIGKAVEFHEWLGGERKQQRLHYLKNYWMERVRDLPGVVLHTSPDARWSGALGMCSVRGKKPGEVAAYLFDRYRIHTSPIEWANISGVRITPNVYTTAGDLDVLVRALRELAAGKQ